MNHPRMTSSGRRNALLLAFVIAFALPKREECGYPGAVCEQFINRERCVSYELEPWGFSLLERVLDRNVGFAYSRSVECR